MEVLKDYPKEFTKLFQRSFNQLSKVNVKFHSGNEGVIRKYWGLFYIIPLLALHYVTLGLHVSKMIAQGEHVDIAYVLPPFFVSTQGILKAIILSPKINILSTLLKGLGDQWRTNGLTVTQRDAKDATIKKVKLFNEVFHWISLIATFIYLATPFLETFVRRFILHQDCELLLAIRCSYPFDPTKNWLIYAAVNVFHIYSLYLCVFAFVGPELMMITMCALLGMEFTLVSEDLLHVKPEFKKTSNISKRHEYEIKDDIFSLRDIVKRHQKLCVLSSQLNEAFNEVVLIDLLFGGLMTCFYKYAAQFSRGFIHMVINHIAIVASLFIIFNMCYYGELLSRASLQVGDVAYHKLWYKEDKHYQTTISIIMKRSQTPCCLTSLKYAPVTLKLFTKVMTSAWSYFSLLNNIYTEET